MSGLKYSDPECKNDLILDRIVLWTLFYPSAHEYREAEGVCLCNPWLPRLHIPLVGWLDGWRHQVGISWTCGTGVLPGRISMIA